MRSCAYVLGAIESMRTENAIRTSTVLVMNTLQESVAILETASGQCRLGDTLFFARMRHSEEKARRDVREDYGVEEPNAPGEPGRDPQRYLFFAKTPSVAK